MLKKNNVKKHFSKSAATYDENASLQRYIEDKLLSGLDAAKITPEMLLDIGAGTGSGAGKLRTMYRESAIFACDIAHGMTKYAKNRLEDETGGIHFVTADMERLPFKDSTFDLVYSSAAAHWLTDLKDFFSDVKRIVKDDGLFCFSTFGDDTLHELDRSFKDAYKEENKEPGGHVNYFMPFEKVISCLMSAGFNDIKAKVEEKKVMFPSVMDLLQSLKAIGSHKTCPKSKFLGKEFLKRVFDIYESKFKEGQSVFATYEIYYFLCGVKNG